MKQRDKVFILALSVMFLLAVTIGPTALQAVDSLTWEGVLPSIFTGTSGTEAINIAMTESTVGLDVSEDTALTNTVNPIVTLTHTTSGSPANNIGLGIDFLQETTANNTENVMSLNAVITDVTAASEDAKFSVQLMAAGTKAEKFSIGSTGILTLAGSATIDNSTSATNLAIAETNIGLTGATTITGALVQTGAVTQDGGVVTINEAGADYDFRVESNDVTDALKVDAGTNTVIHGAWSAYEYVAVTDQSYSLSSVGKAGIVSVNAGEAATMHFMTDLLTSPGPGGTWTVVLLSGDDLVIDTQGSEKINGQDTHTLDGEFESATFFTDGTHFYVLGGYLE